jgi:endoglucanase
MVSTDCTSANCISSVCQPATQSGLKVQYSCLDPSAPTDRFLQPAFEIGNSSSNNIPFSELKIRYWFTQETGDAPVFSCRSAISLGGCTFVSGTFVAVSPVRTNADHYLEISFTGTATLNAGQLSDFIDTPVSRASNFTETNDYSYDATKAWPNFFDHTKVTLYRNGTLVWGTEP